MTSPLKLLTAFLATALGCMGGTLYIFYPTLMGFGLFPVEEVFANVPVVKATAGLTATSFLAAAGALIARGQRPDNGHRLQAAVQRFSRSGLTFASCPPDSKPRYS